ncbi:putative exported protein [Acinetobacter guillouiae MSP4-18]|nr:putative exported protein [Acinetobacter guillouiae MSP4-18]
MVIKNENSPTGKRQLAMLMMAIATNKTVAIPGAETCTRWADGEDISIVGVER